MPAVPVSATDVDRRFYGASAGWGRQANVLRACPRVARKSPPRRCLRASTPFTTRVAPPLRWTVGRAEVAKRRWVIPDDEDVSKAAVPDAGLDLGGGDLVPGWLRRLAALGWRILAVLT